MATTKERNYYTVSEAAELLDVSPSTVWRWIQAGKLPAYRVGGRALRIRKPDLECVRVEVKPREVLEDPQLMYDMAYCERIKRELRRPPTPEELEQRRLALDRLRQNRIDIRPLRISDLIREARRFEKGDDDD